MRVESVAAYLGVPANLPLSHVGRRGDHVVLEVPGAVRKVVSKVTKERKKMKDSM